MLAHLRTIALGTLVLLSLSFVHGVAASLKARPVAAAPPQNVQGLAVTGF